MPAAGLLTGDTLRGDHRVRCGQPCSFQKNDHLQWIFVYGKVPFCYLPHSVDLTIGWGDLLPRGTRFGSGAMILTNLDFTTLKEQAWMSTPLHQRQVMQGNQTMAPN
jgi:hypothetical protein